MIHRLSALLLLAPFATGQTAPRLMITEVLVDPVGANAGAQVVELHNTGNTPIDVTGWHLTSSSASIALPGVVIDPYRIARMHLGRSGTSSPADLFLPAFPELSRTDALGLFQSAQVTDPNALVDFVAWNGGQGSIHVAVQARQWPSTLESVRLPSSEGHTIAHFDAMTYGSPNVPEAWFADGTPTLGLANDGGGLFAGAYGCPALTFGPQVGSGEEDNRPWVGETWHLDIGYLPPSPTTIFLLLGTTSPGSIALDPFGIPGCFLGVNAEIVIPIPMPPLQGEWVTGLPNDPNLVGAEVLMQGVVPFPGANAANVLVTRVMHAFVGSR